MNKHLIEHVGRDGASLEAATVIGADTTITGSIRAQGTVLVDGRVDGNIETDTLVVIGEDGRVIGNIYASSVICRGIIVGDIVAEEEVELLAMASLNGTVRAPLFSVDDSALVHNTLDEACEVEDLSDGEDFLPRQAVA